MSGIGKRERENRRRQFLWIFARRKKKEMRFRGKKNVGAEPRLEPASPASPAAAVTSATSASPASRKKKKPGITVVSAKLASRQKSALPAEDGGGKNRRRHRHRRHRRRHRRRRRRRCRCRGRWREEKPGIREIHLSLKSVA